MSTDEPFALPKKKLNLLWWLGGGVALLVVLFFLQLFGPNPQMIVSPQTTHITSPLGPDGLPDYEQYVLEKSREGVTPENNAATLLYPALWPGELEPKDYAAVATALGLAEIPDEDEALVDAQGKENIARVIEWLSTRELSASIAPTTDPGTESETPGLNASVPSSRWEDPETWSHEVLGRAGSSPWTDQQIPPLALWVTENKEPLDIIVEATKRPRLFLPSPSLINKERELLIHMVLPGVQSVRAAGRSLSARAMWHLGEGRTMEAWSDVLAIHRLSRLLTQGRTLVEQLVAMAMSGIACDNTVTLLDHGNLTVEQARQIELDLAALPVFNSVAKSLDEGERLLAVDTFVRFGNDNSQEALSAMGMDDDVSNAAFGVVSVDWNLVLRETNLWYDRLVAAASLPDQASRRRALDQIDDAVGQLEAEVRVPTRLLGGVISRGQRSKLVASMMLSLFLPALGAATNTEDRANNVLDLVRVAAAVAVYRAEHLEYPETLDQLVPGVVNQLPVDRYNGKPFIYKRVGSGYLLYTTGENGVDDGGSSQMMSTLKGHSLNELDPNKAEKLRSQIPSGADDISIRVPKAKLELPKLPTAKGEP